MSAKRYKIFRRVLSGVFIYAWLIIGAAAQTVQIGEVGTQGAVSEGWKTVTLTGTYTDPIIVAKTRNLSGGDIGQPRIRNVTSTSFQVKFKDFDYEEQNHSNQTMSYIVVERGAWVLPNGQKIEAGDASMTCCDVDASTSFATQFSATPAVIVTPNTDRTQSVYYRVKDLTASSFNARFTDADAAGDPEILNWIAMETGGDITYGIGALFTTTQGVDQTWTYGSTFAASPEVFISSRSYLDATPMTNRLRSVPTTTDVDFYQQINTNDVYHLAAEDVSAVAIPAGTVMGSSPLIVTTTADSGGGSLREAIGYANANAAEDDITFDIPTSDPNHSAGVWTITPTTRFDLTDNNISLDASSQTGASCGTAVDLNGVLADRNLAIRIDGANVDDGFRIDSNITGINIKGFAIGNLDGADEDGIDFNANAAGTVVCNYIGVDADGVTSFAIDGHGIETNTSGTAASVTIGDGTYAGRNVIANINAAEIQCNANTTTCDIRGNYIGVLADGFTPGGGNSNDTLWMGGDNAVIGGPTAPERNIIGISARRAIGLTNGSTGTTIENNYIGVAADGLTILDATLTGLNDGIDDNDVANTITNLTIRNNVIGGFPNFGIDLEDVTLSTATIAGNQIGVGSDGVTDVGYGLSGISLGATTHTNFTIGGSSLGDGNVIGFMSADGVSMTDTIGVTLLGNKIGVGADGTTDVGNNGDGVGISGGSNITIGGTGANDGNVISGNGDDGVYAQNTSNLTILGNYIGLGEDGITDLGNGGEGMSLNGASTITIGDGTSGGRNVIGNNGTATENGIRVWNGATNVTIRGNYIGVGADGVTAAGNRFHGIDVDTAASNTITIGGTGVGDGNVVSDHSGAGLALSSGSDISVLGNFVGTIADGSAALGNGDGIVVNNGVTGVVVGDGTSAGANLIAYNSDIGITVTQISEGAFLANNIYSNGTLGIDLSGNGLTPNDSGDADTGANERLNFPLINTIGADGTTSVGYSVELDVPANTEGYRIEFFKNTSPDTTNGEGEIFLGFVDTGDHAGGAISYDGSFTSAVTVSTGDSISATTTRKTGATSYDITSEFAVNKTAQSSLVVTNTNDSGAGSLRAAITYANANTAEDAITFGIDGAGPYVISPTSQLPAVTDEGISIDGTSQSGASCGQLTTGTPHTLLIRIDGAISSGKGLVISGANVVVRGLSITGFPGRGVDIQANATNALFECNYIGVQTDGETKGPNVSATNTPALHVQGVSGAVVRNSLISGNDTNTNDLGLALNTVTNFTAEGNIIGLNASGTTALPNGRNGIYLLGTNDTVTLGGTTAATRNVVSGNASDGIYIETGSTNITILGNYIGLGLDGVTDLGNGNDGIQAIETQNLVIGNGSASGRNVISGNGNSGIDLTGPATGVEVLGNYLGTDITGNVALGNGDENLHLSGSGSGLTDVKVEDNVMAAALTGSGISVTSSASAILLRNNIGVGADGSTALGNADAGIVTASSAVVTVGDGTEANANIIANNTNEGIRLDATGTEAVILGNRIWNNGGLGVDLGDDGVTDNDGGDGDTGPNELLNFPLINTISADGTTSVGYSVELDVPANTEGYRIEFFKNTSPDATNGEGEIFLGFVDTGDHAGGAISYDGSFTSAVAVSSGDSISATTTRKTGATAYDITSEFAVNKTAQSSLVVTNTNDSGAGSLRAAITYANANAGADTITFDIAGAASDVHTITLASALPTLTDDGISIDGTSQGDAVCGQLTTGTPHTLMVQIDGASAGTSGRAFNVNAANVTIRGLSITNFDLQAVNATGNGDNILLDCLYVGIAPDGSTAGANAKNNSFSNAIGFFGLDGGTIRNSLIAGNDDDTADNGIQLSGGSNYTIEGNIIGLDETGTLERGNGAAGVLINSATTGATIGGTTATTRNIISGNTGDGIALDTVSDIDILGNYIGLNAAGMASVPNGTRGIYVDDVSTLNIGNGLATGRNVIVEPGDRPIWFTGGASTVSIDGNYLGTDITGNTSLQNGAGSAEDAIVIAIGTYTDITITDNVMGGFGGDAVEMSVFGSITNFTLQGNNIGVGADGTTALPIAQDATVDGAITVRNSMVVNNMLIGGTGAGEGNIIANSGSSGIFITTSGVTNTGSVVGNTIYGNTLDGIAHQNDNSTLAIYGNSIHSNGGLGIDLSNDGVIDNDIGDGDSGPNDLLNFPLINTITADGTTTVGYSVELDVPANTEGYRIEFFKNNSPDTTNGEGEIFLGFVDTGDHAGGAISYDGSFTSAVTVSTGDSISATTTRKTGATSYDITSEFAVNKTAQSSLVVTNTNDSGAGSLRAAITHANANTSEDNITFDIAGSVSTVHTISLSSALPAITDADVFIDGTTQGDAVCGDLWAGEGHTLRIRIDDGASIGDGLQTEASNTIIKGLSITGFNYGVLARISSDGVALQCNYIGLAPDGATGGNGRGVWVDGANTVVGGLTVGEGNVISRNTYGLQTNGNATNATIHGNFIGTDPTGMSANANTNRAIANHVGTASINEIRGNLISGNTRSVELNSDDTWTGVGGADFVIAGNYFGTDRTGNTALPNGSSNLNFTQGVVNDLVIGGPNIADRNIIAANTAGGISLTNQSDVSILGNYIGVGADGTTDLGNTGDGIAISGGSNITIGGTGVNDGNVISGNDRYGVLASSVANLIFDGNYIGTRADGAAVVANGNNAMNVQGTSSFVVGTTNVGNLFAGGSTNSIGLVLSGSAQGSILSNSFGLAADGTTSIGSFYSPIWLQDTATAQIGDGTASGANTLVGGDSGGVIVLDLAEAAILGNEIYGNAGLGIDLGPTGPDSVTDNDTGDGDSGPNDLLNFPLINTITADGTTTVGYSVELDVPANTEGYRIEFFKNTSPDATNGEGEIFLGFVDTGDHAGGAISYDGSFTSAVTVSTGDSISATTTRKTGATAYDITSEFAVNKTAQSSLVVTNTNDSGAGSLRAAITYANANTGEDNITFDIDGAGPHTITLASALPIIADAGIMIDGSTQTGATCGTLVTGTQHDLRIVINGNDLSINGLAVSGASTTIKGLSIVNTRFAGLQFQAGADNSVAECNYMGMETDGSTVNSVAKSNAPDGALDINGADSVTLHNNLISGTTGNSGDGIRIDDAAVGTIITGNIIGLDATGLLARPNSDVGIIIDAGSNGTIIGGTTTAARNIISGNTVNAIRLRQNQSDVSILGNYLGLGRDGVTVIGNDSSGISVINVSTNLKIGDGTAAGTNYIVGNGGQGVSITSSSTVSIPGNVIYNNIGIGIDLGGNGVSANDNGDSDTGPNDLLNFPVINDFASDGNTGITYDINLDVPAADYRIDFYRNSAPHSTGYGEGEVHLGFVELTHAGGNLQHTGAFTANATVIQGNHISATTTRKTGPSAYDITSEFSLTTTTGTPTELTAAKSVTVYDPTSAGLYSLPGNDVISSLTVTNPGTSPADADSIVIIDAIPAEVTFYNGDIDDGGPHSNAVSFVQTGGANLTFTYAADVKFSNSGTRPNDMAGCTYTPSAGYDTNVTFLCLNPKGAMAAGNPDPTFTVSYRARIK